MRALIFFLSIFLSLSVFAQDTATIMYYNILNFPGTTPERVNDMKNVFHEVLPDLLLVNELETEVGADNILNTAINKNGIDYYARAAFTDGFDTDNMLFYNTRKFILQLEDTIDTDLRVINKYLLYVKDPELANNQDTIWLEMYSMHLKAGDQPEDQTKRLNECQRLRDRLDSNPNRVNMVVGGDFNLQSSTEASYQKLINDGIHRLYDPLNMPGTWHNNPALKALHTQSPRTTSFGGGITGGMDDRFDFILTSNDIIMGTNKVTYIPGTYEAYGNDGDHLNKAIIDAPAHPTIPSGVIQSLHDLSDHIPVIMKVELEYNPIPANLTEKPRWSDQINWWLDEQQQLHVQLSHDQANKLDVHLFNLLGQPVMQEQWSLSRGQVDRQMNLAGLPAGVYLLTIIGEDQQKVTRKLAIPQ